MRLLTIQFEQNVGYNGIFVRLQTKDLSPGVDSFVFKITKASISEQYKRNYYSFYWYQKVHVKLSYFKKLFITKLQYNIFYT